VEGDSMINAGIYENDILVVDRSIKPTDGKIVIAVVNGELTVKRLSDKPGRLCLLPENPRYNPIEITEEVELSIWGVVRHVLHSL
jgi:DNA polymerase V